VIPQYVGNVGVAERTGIEARPVYHAGTWAEEAGRLILAKRITPRTAKWLRSTSKWLR
jgi:hypothetical protein